MVPRLNRPFQESAATLARALAGEEPDQAETSATPAPAVLLSAPRGGRLVWPYVAMLLAALTVVGVTSSWHAAVSHLTVLAALVAGVVALDLVRIDVFERINLSPASVPALALAFLFGPVGPLLAELAIAGVRIARRVPPVKWAFDVGALGLA
ncbi:MAG: hypothetical protein JWM71_1654, partial [Solirubrobacteraceae bacterium]|nr:hypothetical protein [Solirubrobacteraceae bacterium]